MNQNNLDLLSHVIDNVGFQSMELDKMGMAVANYKETEPDIVQAMLSVFANAINTHAQQLAELSELLEIVYYSEANNEPV